MKSMTGYGSHLEKANEFELSVTIKSVNGRFLDVKPHMPRIYQSLESELKKRVKQTYKRGTVDVYVHRRVLEDTQSEIVFNQGAAKKWMKMYQDLSKALKLESEIRTQDIAGLPEVFSLIDQQTVSEKEKQALNSALDSAIRHADSERQREGKALLAELMGYIESLGQLLLKIKKHSEAMKSRIEEKLKLRMSAIIDDDQIDPQRQAQEVTLLVDKADVAEEISRLDEHLKSMSEFVQSQGPIGKKLDFYCQELLREFNTIGSKSVFAELTADVLDAKSDVESLREQVQNVE